MKIEIFQTAPKLSRENLKEVISQIEASEADLVLFPELALNGYKIKDALLEDAFSIDELIEFKNLSLKKDICLGVAL
jgi:omega-amidase